MWHQLCLVLELGRNQKKDHKVAVFNNFLSCFMHGIGPLPHLTQMSHWEMIITCTRFHFFTVYQYC
jgi:hypothetical protein